MNPSLKPPIFILLITSVVLETISPDELKSVSI